MSLTIAFVYKWTHIPSMKWYIGSRTAEGCNPTDGYICSSNLVKPMIIESTSEWKREIIATGMSDEMYKLETEILQLFDARKDPMSFNGHNNDGNFFSPIPWNKGLTSISDKRVAKNGKSISTGSKGKTGLTGVKNGMFGKVAWNKGLDKSNPSVARYSSTLKVNGYRKNKCVGDDNPAKRIEVRKILSELKTGKLNPLWKGYYISPCGKTFISSKEAASEFNVSDVSILRWAKNNKNGWKFIPKTLVATEVNVHINEGKTNV